MDFVRARTQEQIEHRQQDIIKACDMLFQKGGYDFVNIKAISEMTTITRSSIYTYYKTKDEIILDLLMEELIDWKHDLLNWAQKKAPLSRTDFCKQFTQILLKNEKMLQHFCLLYTFLEVNCRIEKLVAFKKNAVPVMATIAQVIQINFPTLSMEKCFQITEEMVSYILGLYPSTHLTQKQKEAVTLSQTGYHLSDFKVLCQSGFEAFLANQDI